MSLLSSVSFPHVHENPFEYNTSPERELVYEISLRASGSSDWLTDLSGAHRLVQALLQGQLMGQYRLLDFLVWPEGLFTRVSLTGSPSLSEFLKFLKDKSTPTRDSHEAFWDDEPRWIKLVTPEKLAESSRLFLERVDQIRQEVRQSQGFNPNLFFYYRDPRLSR